MSDETMEKIRTLVRAHPTITVREMARQMGFAEEASVYYWLRKAGYRGLKALKAELLQGEASARETGVERDWVAEGDATYAQAVKTIATRDYSPWLLPGDEIVLEWKQPLQDGDLVVIDLPGEAEAVRRYYAGSPPLLVHPSRPRQCTRVDEKELLEGAAKVVRFLRRYP